MQASDRRLSVRLVNYYNVAGLFRHNLMLLGTEGPGVGEHTK